MLVYLKKILKKLIIHRNYFLVNLGIKKKYFIRNGHTLGNFKA